MTRTSVAMELLPCPYIKGNILVYARGVCYGSIMLMLDGMWAHGAATTEVFDTPEQAAEHFVKCVDHIYAAM